MRLFANKEEDNIVANMNAICPPPPPSTLSSLCCAVVISSIPPLMYSSSGGENNNDNMGRIVGVTSFLGNQLCSHWDSDMVRGSNNDTDAVVIEEGGSYIDDLDNHHIGCVRREGGPTGKLGTMQYIQAHHKSNGLQRPWFECGPCLETQGLSNPPIKQKGGRRRRRDGVCHRP